jgi:hypothetical protein
VIAAALAVLSCSTDDGEATTETLPPAAASPSSSTDAAPPSERTPTTTITTAAETTTTVSAEQQVLDVHRRFMTDYFARDESSLTVEERNARVAAVAVDPLLTRVQQRTAERQRDGSYEISPGYDSNVVEAQVDGTAAFVVDCSLDRGVLYDANGDVLIGADEEHRIRRTQLVLTEDGWFVSDFFTGGDPCTPGA